MRVLRVAVWLFATLFLVSGLCLVYGVLESSYINRTSNARLNAFMENDLPQIRAEIDQSQERFDLLVNGGFGSKLFSWVSSDLVIGYLPDDAGEYPRQIAHEDWDTIDWLSAEEKDAIVFLIRGDGLRRNFERIGLQALIIPVEEFGGRTILGDKFRISVSMIHQSIRIPFHSELFHSESLGSYELQVRIFRLDSPVPPYLLLLTALNGIICLILFAIYRHYTLKRKEDRL